jgi:6-phosphofructokinase 1
MVIELMGHKAGWLTLAAGVAGGADIILLPEIPYDLDSICQHLTERRRRGKWFSIVAVAEGAIARTAVEARAAQERASAAAVAVKKKTKKNATNGPPDKDKAKKPHGYGVGGVSLDSAGDGRVISSVAKAISRRLGIETRVTVLGHLQRGAPDTADRILATRLGTHAAELLSEGKYNRMVSVRGAEVTSVPIEKVAGKLKLVPPDHPLIRAAASAPTSAIDLGRLRLSGQSDAKPQAAQSGQTPNAR